MRPSTLVFATALSLTSASALALESVRPGLWEHSYSISSKSGQIEKAIEQAKAMMATLPPEQRQMVEQMMAKQGVSLDFAGTTMKMCLSEEQAKNNLIPQLGDNCSQTVLDESSKEVRLRFECSGEPPSSGEGTIRVTSETAYSGDFQLSTVMNGQPDTLNAITEGKWLGANCGDLKPLPN